MEAVEEILALKNGDLVRIFLVLLAAIVAFEFVYTKLNFFFHDFLGIESRFARHEREQNENIEQLQKEFELIKKDQVEIMETMGCVKEQLRVMQDKQDSSDRARLKDRLQESYRYYNVKKEWTHMEKEAFMDLIESYEAAGGKNSFVHDICLPESLTWKVLG